MKEEKFITHEELVLLSFLGFVMAMSGCNLESAKTRVAELMALTQIQCGAKVRAK